jgi:hypothetical protein
VVEVGAEASQSGLLEQGRGQHATEAVGTGDRQAGVEERAGLVGLSLCHP